MTARLLMQMFLTEVHELAVGLCSDQVAMLATIHLYNAAYKSNNLSTEWIDFERLIEWQGPSWIFLGDRPEKSITYFRQISLVTGLSAATFARDRNRKFTVKFRNELAPISKKGVRHLRLVPFYADLRNSQPGKAHPGTCRWFPARARDDPLVMLEMIVIKSLEKQGASAALNPTSGVNKTSLKSTEQKLTPISMIKILRTCFQEEEKIFRLDLLRLNERCLKLLREIRKVCITESPEEYLKETYANDRFITGVVKHMLAGVAGVRFIEPTRFHEACQLMKEVVESEGDQQWKQAGARCFVSNVKQHVADDFEFPAEDVFLFDEREMFGSIIIDDGKGNVRML